MAILGFTLPAASPLYFSDPLVITVVATLIFIVVFLIYLRSRKKTTKSQQASTKQIESPSSNLLEQRREVDGPIEISEGMSLAEIKRAKSAKVRTKAKRATALEATIASKQKHLDIAQPSQEEALSAIESLAQSFENEAQQEAKSRSESEKAVEEDPFALAFKVSELQGDAKDDPSFELPTLETLHVAKEVDPDILEPTSKEEEFAKKKLLDPEPDQAPAHHQARSLEDGLAKTRTGFIQRLSGLFKKDSLDADLVAEVEEILYTADIGPKTASHILKAIEGELDKDAKQDPALVWEFVRNYVQSLLTKRQSAINVEDNSPYVFLFIGVNGVGKTTTIGKIASKYKQEGKSVLIVAGDTFRAAAVEQLEVWGERTGIEVFRGASEQDPASVIYQGIEKAIADKIDIVLCDTAGRLQSNTNLLDELGKISRVSGKVLAGAPHQTLLVLDANTGQNALLQARKFNDAVNITGIVLTKLDGTAKGGIILGISDEINVPITFIGIGEAVEDLRPFDAMEFVEALFM